MYRHILYLNPIAIARKYIWSMYCSKHSNNSNYVHPQSSYKLDTDCAWTSRKTQGLQTNLSIVYVDAQHVGAVDDSHRPSTEAHQKLPAEFYKCL